MKTFYLFENRKNFELPQEFQLDDNRFPSNLVATIFGFKQEPGLGMPEEGEHLEVSAKETKTPKVEL